MDYRARYESWLADAAVDEATKQELRAIAGDEKEIEDRFYKDLEFGTGGMRGVLGAGSNRLNIYTIRKATQGLANYILAQGSPARDTAVVIAHDCRRMSPEFSDEAARVLAGSGIKAYVFDGLRPTPELSFAVRYLKCTAGIVITASHNPPEYNGYKVYWTDGGQTPYPRDEQIIGCVNAVTDFAQIKTLPGADARRAGLLVTVGPQVDDAYTAAVLTCRMRPALAAESDIKIVYTPLHGTGNLPVRRVLKEAGYQNVWAVEEQCVPDGAFPTVESPNPEDRRAFALALELAAQKDADLVIATDPDADRVGVAVKAADGGYRLLTGNMTGVLLADYLLSGRKQAGTLPANGTVVSTVVSTAMARAVTESYGLAYVEVLTGFKYIGEKIKEWEENGAHSFLFGFEESYGCLSGTYARDKDAVAASLLVCETAAYHRAQGHTLLDALEELYRRHGYYRESVESITITGLSGLADMKRMMAALRANPPKSLAGADVTVVSDYLNKVTLHVKENKAEPTALPVSDVLHYTLADGCWACVRPSGTEPKIKLYFGAKAAAAADAEERLRALARDLNALVKPV